MSRVADLARGPKGHPSHPPMTDATIGAYTTGVLALVAAWIGFEEATMVRVGFIAIAFGLVFSTAAILTGLLDYVQISKGTPLRRTANAHWMAMAVASLLFVLTAWLTWPGYHDGELPVLGAVAAVVAFLALTVGGWIGGSIVFAHGMRVVGEPGMDAADAISPTGSGNDDG